ncbi:MAG TPA: hypothetical protein DCZ11_06220 [Gammaproteobacteria bacterium]|nr:hypothetical protein [Gammaproteobacteria bacterium]MCH78019.1 hypothetical protein [Gammaproteobacteria bacterium]
MGTEPMLPARFAEWEPYAATWCLDTEHDRREQRMRSPQAQLEAFYRAVKPRLDEAIQYLNGFSLDALPPPEHNLLNLTLSLVEVSVAVELFFNPWPLDAYPWDKFSVAY